MGAGQRRGLMSCGWRPNRPSQKDNGTGSRAQCGRPGGALTVWDVSRDRGVAGPQGSRRPSGWKICWLGTRPGRRARRFSARHVSGAAARFAGRHWLCHSGQGIADFKPVAAAPRCIWLILNRPAAWAAKVVAHPAPSRAVARRNRRIQILCRRASYIEPNPSSVFQVVCMACS